MMSPLITRYAERMRAAGRSQTTISTRVRMLRHADRAIASGLIAATPDDLIPYLARFDHAWSQATMYAHLRGFYRAMVAAGEIVADPTDNLDRPHAGQRLPNPVSDAQLARALTDSPDQPWQVAVVLAAYAGLRCCELTTVDRADITDEHVHVRYGKGGKGRYVPTHPMVWECVRDRPAGPLVTSVRGRSMSAARLSGMQYRHWSALGMTDVHLHRFRHWFGTALAEQGVGLEVIRELMGHASIETTRGYTLVTVARRRAAVLTLPTSPGAPASQ